MSNVFFVADTHFGHRAIIRFEEKTRPYKTIEDHDNDLVRRWNSRVRKRDVVWLLGDVAWTEEALYEYVPQLNGRIKLVLGNHDTFDLQKYYQVGIESIYGCVVWKQGILLTHMPTFIGNLERFSRNVHGHTHSQGSPEGMDNHHCVSLDCTDRFPVALDELR